MAAPKAASNGARRLPKTLSAEESERLVAMPNLACPTGLRDRCVLELMLRCGLRVSETCQLHLRDVDWRAGEIRLRSEVTKGHREAVAYLDPPTLALLERWKIARRPYGSTARPHLFVCVRAGQRGRPLTRLGVYRMVSRRAAKAGISHAHPHMLRHTFATALLGEGFNIAEVQKLMRHTDIRTTSIYLEVRDEQLREKIRRRAA